MHADEPLYLRGSELTSQFEIESSTLKKSIRDGEFTFDLAVTNQSGQEHQGPLALVIEKTGVESLLPKNVDHQFADDGQGFLDLLNDNQAVKPGQTLKLRRVRLKAAQSLPADSADQFSPVIKIYRLRTAEQAVAGQPASPRKSIQGQGLPGGIPLRLPGSVAGQGNSRPDEGVKPVPDPIGDTGEPEPVADTGDAGDEAPKQAANNTARPRPTEEELKAALNAKDAWVDRLFKIEGVHSVGRGWGTEGHAVVLVKVEQFEQKQNIPSKLDGVPVEVYVAPPAKAFDRRGQIGYWRELGLCEDGDPKAFYDRPIKIGVSGWNADIPLCATGTLGCRLEDPADPTQKFILSNSHVFADGGLDLEGTGHVVQVGDTIIQPGYADFNCAFPPMGAVGQLAAWSTFNLTGNNTVDAGVATTNPLMMGVASPCNGYGVPSETTVPAVIGDRVMKYGRTSSFTTGTILADNVTSPIAYGPIFAPVVVTFINQIEIIPDPEFAVFAIPGDSGSLIVTRAGHNPVALLFAGSSFSTLGNPIDDVLSDMGGLRVDGIP